MSRGLAIAKFFSNYPTAAVIDNEDEMRERLTNMEQAVSDMRVWAVKNQSIKELEDAQILEYDLARIGLVYRERRQKKTESAA